MIQIVNSREIRANFRTYLDHVMTTGDRVLIYRHGKEVAALVCREDFNALEAATGRNERLMEQRHREAMEQLRVMKGEMRCGGQTAWGANMHSDMEPMKPGSQSRTRKS